ncbi:MAG: hypothetical protein GMKNLPBB_02714 [Myxococcota bacterium]|nr:hypothetical protein [Myxococcota bacterium]
MFAVAALIAVPALVSAGDKPSTIDPELQRVAEKVLKENKTPWAAVVVLDPHTGAVLARAEHSEEEPERKDIATAADYPAASLFKIVTAAALIEKGANPDEETCYRGGLRRITKNLLTPNERLDSRCYDMATALGKSANVVFARLALRHLSPSGLRDLLDRYAFGRPLSRFLPVEPSRAVIPEDELEFARTAAGFGEVKVSVMHMAMLAASLANGGKLLEPYENPADAAKGQVIAQPYDAAMADRLREMMITTTTVGTARRAFHDRRGRSLVGQVEVSGKTGSLADKAPFRDYSWFIGVAPADNPKIAVASLVVNGPKWRIKSGLPAQLVIKAWSDREKKAAKKPVRAESAPSGKSGDQPVLAVTPSAPAAKAGPVSPKPVSSKRPPPRRIPSPRKEVLMTRSEARRALGF